MRILTKVATDFNDRHHSNHHSGNHNHSSNDENDDMTPGLLAVRVAGGWVRDKLLGLSTHDVDIAVSAPLTGVQFATLVQDYIRNQQQPQQTPSATNHNSDDSSSTTTTTPPLFVKCGTMGVIAANPAQSKHLETATMKVAGLEVDFCNLRANEVYADHSRIPSLTQRFGSVADDAWRRDFTCNALYYNVLTQQVEDWTQRGYRDLRAGRLVTPLDPHTTLTDDPLRVLRAIRFAVRYQFQLDPALQQAAVHPDIHQALHVKVSRERVGKELEAMLSGKGAQPVTALNTLADLKLAGSVFCVPLVGAHPCAAVTGSIAGRPYPPPTANSHHHHSSSSSSSDTSDEARHVRECGWVESQHLLSLLPAVLKSHGSLVAAATTTATQTGTATTTATTLVDGRLLPLAVFLLPFRHLQCSSAEPVKNNGGDNGSAAAKKQWSAVTHMMREGIKFKNTDVQVMTTLMDTVDRMAQFLWSTTTTTITKAENDSKDPDSLASRSVHGGKSSSVHGDVGGFDAGVCRLEVGLLIRQTKEYWVTALLLATVLLLRQQQLKSTTVQASTVENDKQQQQQQKVVAVDWLEVGNTAYQIILQLDLDGCWKMRPLLDGKAVIDALYLSRGPNVGVYMEEQVHWMLQHPKGTRDECLQHLQSVERSRNNNNNKREGGETVDNDAATKVVGVGVSDGTVSSSSPIGSTCQKSATEHFSKKMHVESMDISR